MDIYNTSAMNVLKSDLHHGKITVRVEDIDDLWILSQIIESGDRIGGRTVRKIKVSDKSEESVRQFKKNVHIQIGVERIEFHEHTNSLRVSGKVLEEKEDIPAGCYHTFTLESGSVVTIEKEKWPRYQIERIRESERPAESILICNLDRENAIFVMLEKRGYTVLSKIRGNVQKKQFESKPEPFYNQLSKCIEAYDEKYNFSHIILASPAFWNEELKKEMKNQNILPKIKLAACSDVGESAINEILKRPELRSILRNDRLSMELALVEEVLVEISKDGAVAYGFEDVKNAVNSGAVAHLIVSTRLIKEMRLKDEFQKLEELMELAEQMKGKVNLIESGQDAGKKLDALGGIAAKLRYKIY